MKETFLTPRALGPDRRTALAPKTGEDEWLAALFPGPLGT